MGCSADLRLTLCISLQPEPDPKELSPEDKPPEDQGQSGGTDHEKEKWKNFMRLLGMGISAGVIVIAIIMGIYFGLANEKASTSTSDSVPSAAPPQTHRNG